MAWNGRKLYKQHPPKLGACVFVFCRCACVVAMHLRTDRDTHQLFEFSLIFSVLVVVWRLFVVVFCGSPSSLQLLTVAFEQPHHLQAACFANAHKQKATLYINFCNTHIVSYAHGDDACLCVCVCVSSIHATRRHRSRKHRMADNGNICSLENGWMAGWCYWECQQHLQ